MLPQLSMDDLLKAPTVKVYRNLSLMLKIESANGFHAPKERKTHTLHSSSPPNAGMCTLVQPAVFPMLLCVTSVHTTQYATCTHAYRTYFPCHFNSTQNRTAPSYAAHVSSNTHLLRWACRSWALLLQSLHPPQMGCLLVACQRGGCQVTRLWPGERDSASS